METENLQKFTSERMEDYKSELLINTSEKSDTGEKRVEHRHTKLTPAQKG